MSIHLSLEELLDLVDLESLGPVRDVGLLNAAAVRPEAAAFGKDAYPDIPTKAAALLQSITRNHALIDGNERLGWLATETFLSVNGYLSTLTDDQAFDLVQEVATGQLEDVTVIGERLAVGRSDSGAGRWVVDFDPTRGGRSELQQWLSLFYKLKGKLEDER